ncbi:MULTISPECIES: hypothetical protein [unclassified Bacillus (in: firmicutes)]|nr:MULTISPECIES: hypothetical protein [unclassified Bacillus (in: firmicutes)]
MYKDLMKIGYKLHEIDEMDIEFYFELMASVAEDKVGFIDDVF